jgi:hypothetical protein
MPAMTEAIVLLFAGAVARAIDAALSGKSYSDAAMIGVEYIQDELAQRKYPELDISHERVGK